MQIQPLEPMPVTIKTNQQQLACALTELNESEMIVQSQIYLEKDTAVIFISTYFRGEGTIRAIEFKHTLFTYTIAITGISFNPGMIINQRL